MRIAINGWFWDQFATGSGQYLAALAEWLPRVGGRHEFVLVKPTNRGAESPLPNTQILHARTPFDHLNRNLA